MTLSLQEPGVEMPWILADNVLAAGKGAFGPQVLDNRLNPYLLAVANHGY